MRSWISWLVHERLTDIALALALGTALATLAEKLAEVPVSVLAQHAGRDLYQDQDLLGLVDPVTIYSLNFSLGRTAIAYGPVLSALVALGLLGLAAVAVVRRRDRQLGVCPFCASRIPYESRHCAYCGSTVASGKS